ncbi:ATPase family protein associated with various cellular activities (AAA) [Frankia torreyi]|uniref:ATPase family protein associated with various cellular activities (AAA) n=2 Tax=Frankiaceae TaxID=74712 RepID=A0A0D8BKK7_9ACTN|nr:MULTISPECIES: AAA family ATPase [Frankia]KJE24630.1 ATPase family protein associated with various cellular activities (AAA) [Frankia torreyi]KQC37576.1 ATPase [Frankia sp. ACN1ag]
MGVMDHADGIRADGIRADGPDGPVPPGGPTASTATAQPETTAKGDGKPRRRPLPLWDRVKFLILLGAVFLFVVAADVSGDPLMTWGDAFRIQARKSAWVLVLFGLEVLHQLHMLIAERWSAYHVFWTDRVFGRAERRMLRLNDWNRYRLSRAAKWVVALALALFVYARLSHTSVFDALVQVPGDLWKAIPFVLQIVLLMVLVVGQFVVMFWFLSKGGVDTYFPEDITTRFADVWGQDHVVSRVQENVFYLERPEEIESRGGHVPGGILLWGPPGTGKTLIAEAVAGETGKPFVFVDPGAFSAMFIGVGILKVKSLFRKLRKLSLRYGGVIVFFDEADTLGSRGALNGGFGGMGSGARSWFARQGAPAAGASRMASGMAGSGPAGRLADPFGARGDGGSRDLCNGLSYLSSAARSEITREQAREQFVMGGGGGGFDGTLQALLTEMSGLKKPRGFLNRVVRRTLGMRPKPPPKYRILVMMATNMPQSLDEALLRPGRIDRQYKVGYPSKEGRIRTFEGYLAKVRHELTPEQIDRLAIMSPESTGATIKDTVNEALVQAVKDGREVITWQDMLRARVIKEYGLADDHEHIDRERHSIALHEACHAVVAYRMQRGRVIDLATIERRGGVGGFVAHVAVEDRMFMWKSEIEIQVMVSLASLAGERMFFEGDNTVGVGGDLRSATLLVANFISSAAMGETLASRLSMLEQQMGNASIDADRPFGEQVEVKLRELYERTEAVLGANRREILALTHALETHKTITGEDVEAIMEGRTGPTVDGRRYHEPDFLNVAERYHSDAVRAHRGQTRELHKLPELGRAAASSSAEAAGSSFTVPAAAPPTPLAGRPSATGQGQEAPGN